MRRLAQIVVVACALFVGNAKADSTVDPQSVLDAVETGLELLTAGRTHAAFEHLNAANELAQDHRPGALATFYPNAALALYFHDAGQWETALQFAEAAVAGLNAHGLGDDRARILASTVQGAALFRLGRLDQAEPVLREVLSKTQGQAALADLYGMALHALARVLSRRHSPDAAEMRQAFLDGYSAQWRVLPRDVAQLRYLHLQAALDQGADPAALLPEARQLADTNAADLPEAQRLYYRGFYGTLLLRAGRFEDAERALRQHHDFLRAQDTANRDRWENARHLAEALFHTQSAQTAYDFLASELEQAHVSKAPVEPVALFHRDMGRIARAAGNDPLAQAQFRQAYAVARGALDATSALATHLRGFVDSSDPGFSGYAFHRDILSDGFRLQPRSDAAHVLHLFLEGRFIALHDYFRQTRPEQIRDRGVFHINRALFHALSGSPDAMEQDLRAARQAAEQGSELHPQAPVFAIVTALGFAWGSEHAIEHAQAAIDRMPAPPPGGTASLLRDALMIYASSLQGDKAALSHALQSWIDNPATHQPQGPWAIFANVLALEMAFGNLPIDRLAPVEAATRQAMQGPGAFALARSLLDMARSVLVQSDNHSEAALSARVLAERHLSDMLPPGHPVLSSARFLLANSYFEHGDATTAAEWTGRAITTLRATPYHDRDRLAYLMARHGRVLSSLGQYNAAMAQTSAALALVPEDAAMTGTYLGEVLSAHAETLWARTGNPAKLLAFLDPWVARTQTMARLLPETRTDLLIQRAFAMARLGREAGPAFDMAQASMASPYWDWRTKSSRLALMRAEYRYSKQDYPGAWDMARRATDLYTDWLADGAGAGRVQRNQMRHRALWEAGIGWALEQSLGSE